MTAPRTTKEEIEAKRAWRAEKEKRRAEHAADQFHRSVEEQRKAEAEEAERRRFADLHDALREVDQRLGTSDLSQCDEAELKDERARLSRLLKRANRV